MPQKLFSMVKISIDAERMQEMRQKIALSDDEDDIDTHWCIVYAPAPRDANKFESIVRKRSRYLSGVDITIPLE